MNDINDDSNIEFFVSTQLCISYPSPKKPTPPKGTKAVEVYGHRESDWPVATLNIAESLVKLPEEPCPFDATILLVRRSCPTSRKGRAYENILAIYIESTNRPLILFDYRRYTKGFEDPDYGKWARFVPPMRR